jgi:hypothetical protein
LDNPKIKAHTVNRLHGKNAFGNVPGADEKFKYPELDDSLGDKKEGG